MQHVIKLLQICHLLIIQGFASVSFESADWRRISDCASLGDACMYKLKKYIVKMFYKGCEAELCSLKLPGQHSKGPTVSKVDKNNWFLHKK